MGLKDPCMLFMSMKRIRKLKNVWEDFMNVNNTKIVIISKSDNIEVIKLHPQYMDNPNAKYPLK